MPGTAIEKHQLATELADHARMPDDWPDTWEDGTAPTREEQLDVIRLVAYIFCYRREREQRMKRSGPRAKAMRLLKRFLTPEQQAQLQRGRSFYVHLPSGRSYRFLPGMGRVEEVSKHQTRYFIQSVFCIHPPDEDELPPGDIALAQLMHLLADEDDFRNTANITIRNDRGLWDGDYLRRLRHARLERARIDGLLDELLPEPEPDACPI